LRFFLAVGAPVFFLALLETALWLAGFGYPTSFFLSSSIGGQSMRIQNDRFAWRFLGREMARQPFPFAIPAAKPANTVRIFVLGESAGYGDPQPEFGLARMIEALLSGRYPGTRFEVVNASMTAINSHVLLPVARDCSSESGDAWVVYMGNNEVVGPFGAGTVFGSQRASLALIRANLALKRLRCGQLIEGLLWRLRRHPDAAREWGGMAMFVANQVRSDDPRMGTVYSQFRSNLQGILKLGSRHGAKVVVGTVASNLKDCAPFASLHRNGLQTADLAEWTRLYNEGLATQHAGRLAEASELFRRASGIDDSFADLQFAWGQCCLALGNTAEAHQHLTMARDADTLRFRADSRINEIIRTIAAGHEAEGVGFVDTARTLEERSVGGVTGDDFLYEHVHLKFEGNYLLARTFAEALARIAPVLSQPGTKAAGEWPTPGDCAKRLGWTDWQRYQGLSGMLGRITDAPFTSQMDHAQQYEKMMHALRQLRPATTAPGLAHAIEAIRNAQAEHPGDWILDKELALAREQTGDYTGAAESWQAVLDILPHYVEGWQVLGRTCAESKQDTKARDAFEKALALAPDPLVALTGLAEASSREGKQDEALDYYRRILNLKPYWGPAHWGMGRVLETLGRSDEAQAHFKAALQNRVYTPTALKGLAALCYEKGWLGEAATNFMDALKLDPLDASTELNLGLTLAMMNRNREAMDHYERATGLNPNLAEAHVRLGFELGRQGNDAAAMDHFAKAVQLKPELLEARLDLGIALLNQHRENEALQQFQEVLRRSPTNAVALKYIQRLSGSR
jgi:tetratricopeptide (TPR) repeat protein